MTWNEKTRSCWNVSRVPSLSVYDPTSDETIFFATHTPFPLKVRSSGQIEGEGNIVDESELVKSFYSDPNPDGAALYSVLGDPGTGKSQLIRLIHLSKHHTKINQHIAYIPKHKTDLRGALEKILDGLTGQKYDELRQKLRGAINQIDDPKAAEDKFVTELGSVMRFPETAGGKPELMKEQQLLELLASVVSDQPFREKTLAMGAPRRIIARVLGTVTEDDEPGLEFTKEEVDAIFSPGEIEPGQLSENARKAWATVANPMQRANILKLINRYVSVAVNRVFRSSGTSLVDLMNELRLLLYEDQKELVLLIEDMYVLTGIQLEFFQALITTVPSGEPIAPIRSIFAITHGDFNELPDTVQQRIGRVIQVQSLNNEHDPDSAVRFFARYLNAARLSQKELDSLYLGQDVPEACNGCVKKEQCHAAFGVVDGIGLFPFTRDSFGYLKGAMAKGSQVPRTIVTTLIGNFLPRAAQDLELGQFPSESLLAGFKNPDNRNPSSDVEVKLKRQFPNDYERIVRLQRYWAPDPDSVPRWDPFFNSALQLPVSLEVGSVEKTEEGDEGDSSTSTSTGISPLPKVDQLSEAFRKWSTGSLESSLANETRRSVYFAVCSVLEQRYGVRTGNNLINEKSGNQGSFFRPLSIRLPRAQGGTDGETSFAQFDIADNPESRSIVQFLVSGKYENLEKLGETIAWTDDLARKVYDEYLVRFGDLDLKCATVIVSSHIQGRTTGVPYVDIRHLSDSQIPNSFYEGRSSEWRNFIERLNADRKVGLTEIEATLGTGKKGGATLTTRFAAYTQSKPFEKLISNKLEELKKLVQTEVEADNKLRADVRALLGDLTIDEISDKLDRDLSIFDRELPGHVVSVEKIDSIRSDLRKVVNSKNVQLEEIDIETTLDGLLKSLSMVSPLHMHELISTLSKMRDEIDFLALEANKFAEANGFPRDLLQKVENSFASFGYQKDS